MSDLLCFLGAVVFFAIGALYAYACGDLPSRGGRPRPWFARACRGAHGDDAARPPC